MYIHLRLSTAEHRTRTNPYSSKPDANCGEMDEGEEVVCSSVISRGEAAEVFELVEAAYGDTCPECPPLD
jgi:hypothetical protein